jgi:aryl-alcohol dehydrogenase-like predicted oxidoreductase
VEQIALYQFHRPDPKVPFAESLGALAELQAEGKIRHIGLSNVSVEQLREAQGHVPIASVQNRYNVTDRASDPVVDECESANLAFLPWAPVQDGDSGAVANVAERHGVTTHQVLLAWLLARSPSMLPIPGTGSVAHLEENVAAAGIPLDADDLAALAG